MLSIIQQITENSEISNKNESNFDYMYFKSSYLRVVTPVTEDGNRPKLYNGQQVYKETALPLSAKKHLDEQNRNLPQHLRKIIEVVSNDEIHPAVTNAAKAIEPVMQTRNKPGPKPKHLQNAKA